MENSNNRRKPLINRKNDKPGYKTCNKCKQELESTYFGKSNVIKDGLTGSCKKCTALRNKDQYQRHRARNLLHQYNKIDERKGLSNNLTIKVLKELIEKPCIYCGDTIEPRGSDRLDNSQGHNIENIVPCCATCNGVKSNKFNQEEMYKLGTIIKTIKQNRKNE